MNRADIWAATACAAAVAGLCAAATRVFAAPPAEATRGNHVVTRLEQADVDWTRGMIVARGGRAAPWDSASPAVARAITLRAARQAAKERLRAAVLALPLGQGKHVAEIVSQSPTVAARLDRALARALELDVDYGSDASVSLTAGLPLDAVRAAVFGPAPAPPGGFELASAPSALLIDARGVLAEPSLGVRLVAGVEHYRGPTVFYRDPVQAASDWRRGERVRTSRASTAAAGDLHSLLTAEDLVSARAAGALIILVVGD